jgi:hypothetical protein
MGDLHLISARFHRSLAVTPHAWIGLHIAGNPPLSCVAPNSSFCATAWTINCSEFGGSLFVKVAWSRSIFRPESKSFASRPFTLVSPSRPWILRRLHGWSGLKPVLLHARERFTSLFHPGLLLRPQFGLRSAANVKISTAECTPMFSRTVSRRRNRKQSVGIGPTRVLGPMGELSWAVPRSVASYAEVLCCSLLGRSRETGSAKSKDLKGGNQPPFDWESQGRGIGCERGVSVCVPPAPRLPGCFSVYILSLL